MRSTDADLMLTHSLLTSHICYTSHRPTSTKLARARVYNFASSRRANEANTIDQDQPASIKCTARRSNVVTGEARRPCLGRRPEVDRYKQRVPGWWGATATTEVSLTETVQQSLNNGLASSDVNATKQATTNTTSGAA